MSRPARWDMATGRLYRQAAALSGKGIRACVRIAAGSVSRNVTPEDIRLAHSEPSVTDTSQLPGASVPGLFPFPLCGGPPSLGTREAATGRVPPFLQHSGRQLFHNALHASVEPLKSAHSNLRIGSRRPSLPGTGLRDQTTTFVTASFAHEGDRGWFPYDGNFTAKDGNVAR